MQTSSWIWTRIAVSINYDNNHNITSASKINDVTRRYKLPKIIGENSKSLLIQPGICARAGVRTEALPQPTTLNEASNDLHANPTP